MANGWFQAVVFLDLASYLAAAAIITTVTITPTDQPPRITARITGELLEGLRHIARTPLLRGLFTTGGLYWTANAALTALLIPFVATRLHSSGQTLGVLVAGLGVGYLGGSAISKTLITRYEARTILVIAYASVGLCFFAMFTTTSLPIALGAVTVCGVPGAVVQVVTRHRMQTSTPDTVLGRVSAAFYTSDSAAAVAGALIAPAVVALTGLTTALIALSGAVLATAALAAIVLPAASIEKAEVLTPARLPGRRARDREQKSRSVSPWSERSE